jgi:hypothetical protein
MVSVVILLLSVAYLSRAVLLSTASVAATPAATGVIVTPDGPIPATIRTTVRRGSVAVTLTVAPPAVGPALLRATVMRDGTPLTDDAVRIRLWMPAQPGINMVDLSARPADGGYQATAEIQALGRWRAAVTVHGQHMQQVIPFDFMSGPNARFLFAQPPDHAYGPATAMLVQTAAGSTLLKVQLDAGLAVRAVVQMPNMPSMGASTYVAQAPVNGWYGIALLFPMTGVVQVDLQVRRGSAWRVVRTLLYDVDSYGHGALLTNTPA